MAPRGQAAQKGHGGRGAHFRLDFSHGYGDNMNVHSFRPQVARQRDTKAMIERTALRLFVEQGVAETSIKEIAKAAGVSQGAMYNHYASKEELAWTLFARNFSELGHGLWQRAGEHAELEQKFRAMVAYVFERFEQDWTLVSFVFFARHEHLRKVGRGMGNPYVAFRMVIARAIKRGEIPAQNVELATSLVTGAIIQVIDTKILGQMDAPLRSMTDAVAAACVRLLRR